MSLFRQLWLAVILVTLTSFSGSISVSLLSTHRYLEQELHRKNVDTANALAHSISRLGKDPVTVGLQIDAFFSSGQYATISITSPDGKVIIERVANPVATGVPDWFVELFPISAPAGLAQIPDSWINFGVIKVVSSASLAHQALWEQTETLLSWFLAAGILCGFIGMLILQRINKPLAAMVAQSEAILDRSFLTVSEPRIAELRTIARAMNDLVRRLHNRTLEEALRLDAFQQQINHDPITGLSTREYFMDRFGKLLDVDETGPEAQSQQAPQTQGNADTVPAAGGESISAGSGANGATGEEAPASDGGHPVSAANTGTTPVIPDEAAGGVLFLIRLHGLEQINQKLGYRQANRLLRQIGDLVSRIAGEGGGEPAGRLAARLNGSDFALIVPHMEDATEFANRLMGELAALSSQLSPDSANLYHIGAIHYHRGDKLGDLLAKADSALATAERAGANAWHISNPLSAAAPARDISNWRDIFGEALAQDRFKLVLFPVAGAAGAVLHQEAFVRMQAQPDGGWLDASDFITIAARLNLTGALDLTVIRHALQLLESSTDDLAINLCIESVAARDDRDRLVELLRQHSGLCSRLWVEVPEQGAFGNIEALRDFCQIFRELGCRTGIEHFGHHRDEFGQLTGLGLHYLKVDPSFVHGINQNKSNQKFLKGLCTLARGNGIMVIAGGVQTEAEVKTLTRLGFKGFTGPGVKQAPPVPSIP
ncbi:EAL domain-containing protein [Nitrosospira sp. Is2]|uniref:EAL domain-containing protein n=1 Tax=Nitrosospira sp. Is2 TaxID=3080532 RepID=UPI0029556059|nr:EAL domain-containing protein [Nitrosospira sp. Is2]WON73938.1 EAL domain-containing protein [Nitrosospira sp. Is2]